MSVVPTRVLVLIVLLLGQCVSGCTRSEEPTAGENVDQVAQALCYSDRSCGYLNSPCKVGKCSSFLGGTCYAVNLTNGTTCDDANACTSGEVCQSGVCTGGRGKVCTAQDQCHVAGTCAPATGMCSNPPKGDGVWCNDGNKCTQTDKCQAGVCTGSNPLSCTSSNPCVTAGCSPSVGCVFTNNTNTCDDGNECTYNDTCHGGSCGGTPIECNSWNPCTTAACDSSNGECVETNVPDGTTCDDGDPCTLSTSCDAGICRLGVPKCTSSNPCKVAVCSSSGVCSEQNAPTGTTCDDHQACTEHDTCTSGVCSGTAKVCTPENDCYLPGTCNPTTGACSKPMKSAGADCQDGNGCTQGDKCDGSGHCTPGTPTTCPGADGCHVAAQCNPANGSCGDPIPKPDGTDCDDGLFCTDGTTCQAGACTGGTPKSCSHPDDKCNDWSCDEVSDRCVATPADGRNCDDGILCDGAATCLGGTCRHFSLPALDDGNECTVDACSETEGITHVAIEEIEDDNSSTIDLCDPETGAVQHVSRGTFDLSIVSSPRRAGWFLVTGTDPIQHGVAAACLHEVPVQPANPPEPDCSDCHDSCLDSIDTSMISGRVLTPAGTSGLPGVKVTVVGHPEYGWTLTRADGSFAMLVRAGSYLLSYQSPGYLVSHRRVAVQRRSYARAEDASLVQPETNATTLGLPLSQGTFVTSSVHGGNDARMPRLFIPKDVRVLNSMGLDWSELTGGVTFRITEYHGGTHTDRAPASHRGGAPHFYEVELGLDEAAGGDVRFVDSLDNTAELYLYVDNYLDIPKGTLVSSDYYDRALGVWFSQPSGQVLKVNSIDGSGAVVLDPEIYCSEEERAAIKGQFALGQSFIRFPVTHFSPHGASLGCWGYMGSNSIGPAPKLADPKRDDQPSAVIDCKKPSSIIGCQSQTLTKTVPLAGTPFHLHYRSDYTGGNIGPYTIHIPLPGAARPPEVDKIRIIVEVAGFSSSQDVLNLDLTKTDFVWDGLDVNGQKLQGAQPITIRIGYVYEYSCNQAQQCEKIKWKSWTGAIGGFDRKPLQLGGWDLAGHMVYDPETNQRWGDDSAADTAPAPEVINTIAGKYTPGQGENAGSWCGSMSGDNGAASDAGLLSIKAMAVASDGTVYFTQHRDLLSTVVRRILTNGRIETAFEVGNSMPRALAVGPDHSVFLGVWTSGDQDAAVSGSEAAVYRWNPKEPGTSVYAGLGGCSYADPESTKCGSDGNPATSVRFKGIDGLAVGPDGTLFFSDDSSAEIRRVTTDKRIETIYRTGSQSYTCWGACRDLETLLGWPGSLTVDRAGELYVAWPGHQAISRISPDGLHELVAGRIGGDVNLTTNSVIGNPTGIVADALGGFYLTQAYPSYDFKYIDYAGYLHDAMGSTEPCDPSTSPRCGDNGPKELATFNGSSSEPPVLAIDPRGKLMYVAENCTIRKIAPGPEVPTSPSMAPSPGADPKHLIYHVPSKDGSVVYDFTDEGRHVRTRDAVTKEALYGFDYNGPGGALSQVFDSQHGDPQHGSNTISLEPLSMACHT